MHPGTGNACQRVLGGSSDPDLRLTREASLTHGLTEIGTVDEGLRRLGCVEVMRDGDVIRVDDTAVHGVAGNALAAAGGVEVVLDLAPGVIVGDVVTDEQANHW